jgi:mannose-6-phosphate isomerase-like protein (cupin superfamily)
MPVGEFDERPWGEYLVLAEEKDHKVKRIRVTPGKRISYQRHDRRSEHWFIISGIGLVTLNAVPRAIESGDTVDVPVGVDHRIENTGTDDLVIIEVQHGEYFGEDDILRLDDDFGRHEG